MKEKKRKKEKEVIRGRVSAVKREGEKIDRQINNQFDEYAGKQREKTSINENYCPQNDVEKYRNKKEVMGNKIRQQVELSHGRQHLFRIYGNKIKQDKNYHLKTKKMTSFGFHQKKFSLA